jgi:hypothetical protein
MLEILLRVDQWRSESVRPIIGARHPVGHELIDGEHVELAE